MLGKCFYFTNESSLFGAYMKVLLFLFFYCEKLKAQVIPSTSYYRQTKGLFEITCAFNF